LFYFLTKQLTYLENEFCFCTVEHFKQNEEATEEKKRETKRKREQTKQKATKETKITRSKRTEQTNKKPGIASMIQTVNKS
jgi:hypothetical protein